MKSCLRSLENPRGVPEESQGNHWASQFFSPKCWIHVDRSNSVKHKHDMLRSELIDKLHQDNPHLTHREMERVVAVFLESITQTLEKGARVELRGFGTFSARKRDARVGRNPRTGESVHVPEKHVPFFRAGKELKILIEKSVKK